VRGWLGYLYTKYAGSVASRTRRLRTLNTSNCLVTGVLIQKVADAFIIVLSSALIEKIVGEDEFICGRWSVLKFGLLNCSWHGWVVQIGNAGLA